MFSPNPELLAGHLCSRWIFRRYLSAQLVAHLTRCPLLCVIADHRWTDSRRVILPIHRSEDAVMPRVTKCSTLRWSAAVRSLPLSIKGEFVLLTLAVLVALQTYFFQFPKPFSLNA